MLYQRPVSKTLNSVSTDEKMALISGEATPFLYTNNDFSRWSYSYAENPYSYADNSYSGA